MILLKHTSKGNYDKSLIPNYHDVVNVSELNCVERNVYSTKNKYKTDIVLHQRVSKLITLQYSESIFIQSFIQNKKYLRAQKAGMHLVHLQILVGFVLLDL